MTAQTARHAEPHVPAPKDPAADGPTSRLGADLLKHAGVRQKGRHSDHLDHIARRMLLAAGARDDTGTIVLTEDGRSRRLGRSGPVVEVTVHDRRAYGALLRSGSAGLGASYVAGWWDTGDLTALVRVLFRRTRAARRALDRLAAWTGPALDRARRPGPGREDDRRNVQTHYDLSNDFFALMLDDTMTYSCARFAGPHASLHDAQVAKLDGICQKLELRSGDHVVEIGSGWGSFAVHAAARYGCRVTTTTISAAQRTHVERRVEAEGLADRVTVLAADWRDLRGRFDKLVSIEMIEAVDWRHHDAFLARCGRLLAEDGLAVLQAIVIDDRSFERAKHHQDFVRRMVFPGGCLPSKISMAMSLARATDLRLVGLEDIGDHYPETLRRWAANLNRHAAELPRIGVGTELHRLWAMYLGYCEAAFLEGHVSDVQILLAKAAWRTRRSTPPF